MLCVALSLKQVSVFPWTLRILYFLCVLYICLTNYYIISGLTYWGVKCSMSCFLLWFWPCFCAVLVPCVQPLLWMQRHPSASQLRKRKARQSSPSTLAEVENAVPEGAHMQWWTGHCLASYIRPLCPACSCAFVRGRNVLFWDKSFVVFVTAKKWESTKPASLPRVSDSLYSSLRRSFPNNIFTVVAAAAWALFSLDDFSWLACAACFP